MGRDRSSFRAVARAASAELRRSGARAPAVRQVTSIEVSTGNEASEGVDASGGIVEQSGRTLLRMAIVQGRTSAVRLASRCMVTQDTIAMWLLASGLRPTFAHRRMLEAELDIPAALIW